LSYQRKAQNSWKFDLAAMLSRRILILILTLCGCVSGHAQNIHSPCQNGTCPSFVQLKNTLSTNISTKAIMERKNKRSASDTVLAIAENETQADPKDYEKGKCVGVQEGSKALDEVEVFFKVNGSRVGRSYGVIFAEDGWAPGQLTIWSKKESSHWYMGVSLRGEAWNKFHNVEFHDTHFYFDHEYEVKIFYSAKTGNIKLFVTGSLKVVTHLDSPYTTVLMGPSQIGCHNWESDFPGSISSFRIGSPQGCEDHTFKKKEKWHDSDGSKYDCQWYQKDNNCEKYGDGYENEGLTANEACCACGGGWTPTTTTTTLTGATYDYIRGKSGCVWVKNFRQNLSAVEFSFKVKNWGNDWARRPVWDANWKGPKDLLIWAQIASNSFDTAGKKNGIEYFKKWNLAFNIWFPLKSFEEKVEFSTPFEFFHEYDVKILYSAELDKVKLFVHGEEKEDQKFTTPLSWMEVLGGVIGCNTYQEKPFFGSVKSFKIGPSMDLADTGN